MEERLLKGHNTKQCWQYDIRTNNLTDDILGSGFSKEELSNLTCADFDFRQVEDKDEQQKIIKFIKRHEWLGTLSQYSTHWFAVYYKGVLAGAIIMNMPNAFTKALGEDTPKLERLISRGACISWSPKNLASKLIMFAIEWMVQNTRYRLFVAYSDPLAKELGTIYQACNFYYMGKSFGTTTRYINPYTGKIVSDRFFRVRSAYKRYAKELGFDWQKNWTNERNTGMEWGNVPDHVEVALRQKSRDVQSSSEKLEFPAKHKYSYVLGKDKKETRELRKRFLKTNKVYPYPKERGK